MIKHERFDDLLEQVKVILAMNDDGQNENYDKVLEFSLSKVIQDVANYLNTPVNELAEELDYTIIAMTVQIVNTHDLLKTDKNVQSLTEGDTSITFKDPAAIYQELQKINVISDDYLSTLNNFRRLPE